LSSWNSIVRRWLYFWNKVREAWYDKYPKKFGHKYNAETKKWLQNGCLIEWNGETRAARNVFKNLIKEILDYFSDCTISDAFDKLRELFAIQYGIHEKWYAESRKPKPPVIRNPKAQMIQYLRLVLIILFLSFIGFSNCWVIGGLL